MAGGYCRLRRTDPHRNPSSRNTSRPARSPEPAALCLSVDPPQDLPLSSSTAEAAKRVVRNVALKRRLCNTARSFDLQPCPPAGASAHAALADPHGLDAVLAHGLHAD